MAKDSATRWNEVLFHPMGMMAETIECKLQIANREPSGVPGRQLERAVARLTDAQVAQQEVEEAKQLFAPAASMNAHFAIHVRSTNPVSMSPPTNTAFCRISRWKSIVVATPSMRSSPRARSMQAIASSRVG